MLPHCSLGSVFAVGPSVGALGASGTGAQMSVKGQPSLRSCEMSSAACAQRLQMSGSHSRAAAKQGHARVPHVPVLQLHPGKAFAHCESGPRQLQYFSQKFPSLMHAHVFGLHPPGPQSHGVYWVHTWSSSFVMRRRITAVVARLRWVIHPFRFFPPFFLPRPQRPSSSASLWCSDRIASSSPSRRRSERRRVYTSVHEGPSTARAMAHGSPFSPYTPRILT